MENFFSSSQLRFIGDTWLESLPHHKIWAMKIYLLFCVEQSFPPHQHSSELKQKFVCQKLPHENFPSFHFNVEWLSSARIWIWGSSSWGLQQKRFLCSSLNNGTRAMFAVKTKPDGCRRTQNRKRSDGVPRMLHCHANARRKELNCDANVTSSHDNIEQQNNSRNFVYVSEELLLVNNELMRGAVRRSTSEKKGANIASYLSSWDEATRGIWILISAKLLLRPA